MQYNCMPSGGSAKELHPPWAKLSSLGPKGPWGCKSFALPPEGMQLPIDSSGCTVYHYSNHTALFLYLISNLYMGIRSASLNNLAVVCNNTSSWAV